VPENFGPPARTPARVCGSRDLNERRRSVVRFPDRFVGSPVESWFSVECEKPARVGGPPKSAVEIPKAALPGADILCSRSDSELTPQESSRLSSILESLAEQGKAIVSSRTAHELVRPGRGAAPSFATGRVVGSGGGWVWVGGIPISTAHQEGRSRGWMSARRSHSPVKRRPVPRLDAVLRVEKSPHVSSRTPNAPRRDDVEGANTDPRVAGVKNGQASRRRRAADRVGVGILGVVRRTACRRAKRPRVCFSSPRAP